MRQSIFPVIAPVLAVAASMAFAGAAWARPPGDERDEAAQTDRGAACEGVEPASDRERRPCDTGVIDHLPDSFFVGGGGVGPQGWDAGGGGRVWAYVAGGASATASAHASASASVRVSVSAHAGGHR